MVYTGISLHLQIVYIRIVFVILWLKYPKVHVVYLTDAYVSMYIC